MQIALYARVSTSDQDCKVQLAELRRYAASRGWDVFAEYVDTGFSGKTANRPALKRCMADARARRFDCIAVWKLDRWGRTVAQLSQDVIDFDSLGIRFIAVETGIDTDKANSMSRFTLHIMAAFAELERSMIAERVIAGVKHAQKHGTKSGAAIGRPVKVFDRQQVRDMRAAGSSLREIAAATGQPLTSVRRAIA